MTGSPASPAHRLAHSSSAYLRSAAEQEIGWYPWGEEAFRSARESGRPILLDIGAAWCHWCHVMDEGTYSDPKVAALVNQLFVPVKVDRDENPEVDRRYQLQVNALTGQGGWPLTAFLTPQGEVFLGGTYFPPDDQGGRPGFRRVLREVARLWREERDALKGQAKAVQEGLKGMTAPRDAPPGKDFVSVVAQTLQENFDPTHGGFGGAPKFPHPMATSFQLYLAHQTGNPAHGEMARFTLTRMADGGIYDQLGGGFHRYSVDEGWHIPHFEKMAVDNGHLLAAYREGLEALEVPRFRETLDGIARWALSVLGQDPRGGFAASQDADNSPGDDGSYFTWSRSELRRLLTPDELKAVSWYYGIGSEGQMPHDPERNVLYRLLPESEVASTLGRGLPEVRELLDRAAAKMRQARGSRPTPAVDPALYASLNGILAGNLALAGRLTGQDGWVVRAQTAVDRFLDEAYDPARGVAHQLTADGPRTWGLLEDQVSFAGGLLKLAEVTQQDRYLTAARRILQIVHEAYTAPGGPLLRDLAPSLYDGPKVGNWEFPHVPLEDTPHLSPNAAAALAWEHLEALTSDPTVRDRYLPLVDALGQRLAHHGLFAAGSALAAGLARMEPLHVVVQGSEGTSPALLQTAIGTFHPRKVVLRAPLRGEFALPAEAAGELGNAGGPRALVCAGSSCLPPITEASRLREVLRGRLAGPS
jgi:uncharacterized protein YyaL (SSP411 family)